MKATCIKQIPSYNDRIKLGDVIEITSILYKKDTIIVNEGKRKDPKTGELFVCLPEVVAKKGSYKDSFITCLDGFEIPTSLIPNTLDTYFTKN